MTDPEVKRCPRCQRTLPVTEFAPGKKWRDGLFPYCRPCKRESDRRTYQNHKTEYAARAAARYAANPEPQKERSQRSRRNDPERWINNAVRWNRENPERRRRTTAAWQKRNLDGSVREATRRRYALRKGAVAIKFTKAQLEQRMAYWGNRCWVCSGPREAIDHVKPLTKGGAHMLCNLRPICWSCNSAKGNRWPFNT